MLDVMARRLGVNLSVFEISHLTRGPKYPIAFVVNLIYGRGMKEFAAHSDGLVQSSWFPAVVGVVCCLAVVISWWLLPGGGEVLAVGVLVSVLIALVVSPVPQPGLRAELPTDLETPFLLARDEHAFERYRRATALMLKVSRHHDPIYRDIAFEQIDELIRRLTTIAAGTLVFEGTETWRMVYERLLRSQGLYMYRSVSLVKTADYWQDEPGRKSMAVNFELQDRGALNIERIIILEDELWPLSMPWPVDSVRRWMLEQHAAGIWIKLVRRSQLAKEPDLVADIGIYGSRALGTQVLDERCQTVQFTLTFDYTKVAEAEEHWNRLSVYAESVGSFLDRYDIPG
jgi:hypothetical protein